MYLETLFVACVAMVYMEPAPVPNDGAKNRYFADDRFGVWDLLAVGHFHRGGNLMIYDENEAISSHMRR